MSSSLPTEMTIRSFLSKELEERSIKVSNEISFSTPIGRLVPDLLLRNGATYVVETKLGAESKLLDAIVRLYDYSKYTDAKGSFAVLFPEELRRPWTIEMLEKIAIDPKLKYIVTGIFKDFRPSQRFVGNLNEIADWISSQVLKQPQVETDTSFAIKILSEAVDSITLGVRSLASQDLEEIFGGKTVFENILQYEEGHYPLEEMRQAATYLLVNQIIFYHILSSVNKELKPIDENKIDKPIDLLLYFNEVLKIDYTSVFGFDVVSKLPISSVDRIRRVVVAVKALAPEKIEHDVLGKVFHELIPFNIRKAVAAFYTNNESAEMLANLAIERPEATVADLACGSGTLLVAAYHRKRDLLNLQGRDISFENHKKFLENDLTGIDIMPFAAHLAVMHLSLQALLHETEKVRVAVWDSTELKPEMKIPAISTELKAAYKRPTLDMFQKGVNITKDAYIKKGAITLEGLGGTEIPLEKVDLVIMNPPFTRQERLPKEYKKSLDKRMNKYSKFLHGPMGLYGYFILLGDRFLKPDGRLALVLPATTLKIVTTQGVRDLILRDYTIEYLVTTFERAAFSEGADFREILLIAQKTKTSKKSQSCLIVFIKKMPKTIVEAKQISILLKNKREALTINNSYEDEYISCQAVNQSELKASANNLFKFIATFDWKMGSIWEKIQERGLSNFKTF
jgi:type I restriction-modification system DNA methylase subunit